jgi:hypothetical protein
MTQKNSFWKQQKNGQWKILTEPLKNSEIHAYFDSLITNFYWNFRKQKKIPHGTYTPEINFQGFKGFIDFSSETEMGQCASEIGYEVTEINGKKEQEIYQGTMSITLNQKLLLGKLGMDKWFYSETGYLPVGFDELVETMAHELAHAYQNTIRVNNGEAVKSQCASSGDKNKYPELVAEHTQLTKEIKQMIESSSEYQEFKKWWKSKETLPPKIKKQSFAPTENSKSQLKNEAEIEQQQPKEGWQPWMTWTAIVGGGIFLLFIIWIVTKAFNNKEQ